MATGVTFEGAHFLTRECGHEVSLLLEENILGQARSLERQHLDPLRHMLTCAPSRSSGVGDSRADSPEIRPG
jgi:hypothetical protein